MVSIFIEPKKHIDIIDITSKINNLLSETLNDNITAVLLFVKHTTAAFFINENEPNLLKDMLNFLDTLVKEMDFNHNKIDDRSNAKSHLQSMLFRHSLVIPVKDGKLDLGAWQSIFMVDFDGDGRRREITVLPLS